MLFLLLDFVNHKIHYFISDFLIRENILQNFVQNNSCFNLHYKISFEITDFDPYNTNPNKIKDNLTTSRISFLKIEILAPGGGRTRDFHRERVAS